MTVGDIRFYNFLYEVIKNCVFILKKFKKPSFLDKIIVWCLDVLIFLFQKVIKRRLKKGVDISDIPSSYEEDLLKLIYEIGIILQIRDKERGENEKCK